MADVWANSMPCHPTATYHIAGCCHLANSLSRRNFVKMFDAGKTRMIGLPCGEKKLWPYVKPFSSDIGTLRTDGQTDLLYQYRASVCWRAI